MTENYKILGKFIKDMSSETPDVETFLFVKDNIAKYQLNIDITSKPLKDKIVEINTTFKFEDKSTNEKRSYFEIIFATIVRIADEIKDKKEIEKIILINVPTTIYPELRKIFLFVFENSGFKDVKIRDNVDFQKLYNHKKTQ